METRLSSGCMDHLAYCRLFPKFSKEEITKNGYKVYNLRDGRRQMPLESVPALNAGFCNKEQLATLLLSLDGMLVHHRSYILVNTSSYYTTVKNNR